MVREKETRDGSSKKKRKTGGSEAESEGDIYKRVVEFEEKEALNRPADADAKVYIDICQNIRASLTEIAQLKAENNTESKAKILEKCTDACVKIAVLKKLNRMEKVRLVTSKEALAAEKQKVDSTNLQLHNLLYEANHLVSEFNKCFQFKSKDEDIDLVSVEEFMKDAPASVTSKFKLDKTDETTKHELRLARLEWELQQRKNLSKLCKTLEVEKKKLGTDIVERKKKLDGLAPKLNAVLEATKPLQEHLNLPVDKIRAEHKLASLLPDSLYLLYVNGDAYKKVYGVNMNLVIVGDQEEAVQWKNQQASSSLQDEDESEVEAEQDIEEVVEVKKRRRRSGVKVDPMEEKKKKLLEPHPLSIHITMILKEGLSLTLKCFYYPNLKIVAVKSDVDIPTKVTGNTSKEVLYGENLLGELIPNDLGLESPNSSNNYQFKKVGLGTYERLVPDLGFAYAWAQRVCGLDFLTEQTGKRESNNMSQENVEIIMKTLHRRLQSRYSLAMQLEQLEQNQIPKIPDTVDVPQKIISSLTKWSSKTYQQFCELRHTQNFIDEEIVNSIDIFYAATISRSNASMEAYIVIKNDFPLQSPIFVVTIDFNGKHNSGNSDDVRDLERSLNVGWSHNLSNADWIVAAQITLACAYFDIYLETKYPETFSVSSMFLKNVSGRNRRKPFKYRKVGSGIFTQY